MKQRTNVVRLTIEHSKLALWKRTSFVDLDSGTVFFPAFLHPAGETWGFWVACWEQIPVIEDRGHNYLEATWLAGENEEHGAEMLEIRDRCLIEARAQNGTAVDD